MVTGVAELHAKLAEVPQLVQDEVVQEMEKSAALLVSEMKALVPEDEGDLKSSIGWSWGDAPAGSLTIGSFRGREFGKLKITIYAGNSTTIVTNKRGIEFQNARLQEFGTVNMAANPYFFPVFRANKTRIRSNISRAVTRAFKKSRL